MDEEGNESSQELHFFYDSQSKLAFVEFEGERYRYVHSLQGDIIAIVDSAGNRVVEYKYDAWGKPTSTISTINNIIGEINPFRYRCYIYDHKTGLYYLRTRFYATSQNRFINPDRFELFGFCVYEDSTYCYCVNTPTIYSDEEGSFAVFGFDITIPWNSAIPNVPAIPSIPGIVDVGPVSGGLPIIEMPTIYDHYNVDTGSVESIPDDTEVSDEKYTAKKPAKRIRFNTRKEAYEQAKKAGGGKKPISHKNDKNGPHFHPDVRNKYSKTPKSASSHDHYYYPKRGYSLTTVVENWIDKTSKYLRKIF